MNIDTLWTTTLKSISSFKASSNLVISFVIWPKENGYTVLFKSLVLMFLKEVSYALRGCIYLIKNTQEKNIIISNVENSCAA